MKRIYFLGICGTGMGNAALLAREEGFEVAGADKDAYEPMSGVLEKAGIAFRLGFEAARLEAFQPDLVVVGNSTVRGNPEMEWLLSHRKVPCVSLPAFFARFFLEGRRNIVITGTHGKTTTATLAALLLRGADRDPGYIIGGVPNDLPGGSHTGSPDAPFVIEGDEYDSALFDKRSKFIHYPPHVATINNIEFDHADIFRDLKDVQRSFLHFLKILPADGHLLLNGDDPNVRALEPVQWGTVWRVGCGKENDLVIEDFREDENGSVFRLCLRGGEWSEVRWPLGGLYNARNAAMAALAAGVSLFPDDPAKLSLDSLARYTGVRRRQDLLFKGPGLMVIEDFGHHPTAIRDTLASQKNRFPGRRRVVAFEPRSNTTRRRVMQEDLVTALANADAVYIGAIDRINQLAEEERLDVGGLVAELGDRGVPAVPFASNAELLQSLLRDVGEGPGERDTLVTFFTNGSFDGIVGEFVAEAAKSREAGSPGGIGEKGAPSVSPAPGAAGRV